MTTTRRELLSAIRSGIMLELSDSHDWADPAGGPAPEKPREVGSTRGARCGITGWDCGVQRVDIPRARMGLVLRASELIAERLGTGMRPCCVGS